METLREIWESQGLSPTQVAAQANISTTTLYKVLRKEHVASKTVADVCRVLGISRKEYEQLKAEN